MSDHFLSKEDRFGGVPEKASEYYGLSKALYIVYAVELLGAFFFLLTAIFIKKDKAECDRVIQIGNNMASLEKGTEIIEKPSKPWSPTVQFVSFLFNSWTRKC